MSPSNRIQGIGANGACVRDMDHQRLPEHADAIVVGGGIMGLASAYYLARIGMRTVVLEKDRVASQQSGRNWGFVRSQYRDPAEIQLAIASLRMWPKLEAELGRPLGWRRTGCLFAATNEREAAAFEKWMDEVRGAGVTTRMLSPREVKAMLPALARTPHGALYTAEDGQAEPETATLAFAQAATEAGVDVFERCGAYVIDVEGGRVAGVTTEWGRIRAPIVVCAAGAASHRLLAGIGLLLPQKVVRNTVSLTEPTRELSAPCFCGFGIGVRQRKDMSCIIAAESTSDIDVTLDVFRYAGFFMPGLFANKRAFDLSLGGALVGDVYGRIAWSKHERMVEPRAPLIRPNRRRVRKVTTRVEEVFQAADGIKVRKSWAGNIDVLPDAIPVIDGLTGIVGLIVATGFSGHGFALGPAVGKVVAGIASGRSGDIDLARFQLGRFARGTYGSPYAPL